MGEGSERTRDCGCCGGSACAMSYAQSASGDKATGEAGEGCGACGVEEGSRSQFILMIVSGVALGVSLILSLLDGPGWAILSARLLALVMGGSGPARRAVQALRRRAIDMNVLMIVTVVGAVAISEWVEAATIAFLFSVSDYLESRTMERAYRSIGSLLDIAPKEATVLRDGAQVRVPVGALKPGDLILVHPGERIAADGKVLRGRSSVDQSPITGESMPADKAPDDEVFAGTINGEGALEITVTKLPGDTTLARIIYMVKQAESQKAPVQQYVDRFASWYTPAVTMIAALVVAVPPLAWGQPLRPSIYRGLALLAVSCPCAMVISTPVSILSAVSNAARQGVLVKGGAFLEALGRVNAFAFDKTGTLTAGRLRVTGVESFNGFSADEALAYAAGLENRSLHPIAGAIVAEARRRGIAPREVEDFRSAAGMGVAAGVEGRTYVLGNPRWLEANGIDSGHAGAIVERAQKKGQTVSLLGAAPHDGQPGALVGAVSLGDALRPAAASTVRRLRDLGVRHIAMLTGDNRGTASALGEAAGVDEIVWELLPGDKVSLIEDLMMRHQSVAMVGDGVNDAPALATATVGVAMSAAGSDVALETADVALMSGDLSKIPYVVRLGRNTLDVIRQNIAIALGIKSVAVILVFLGMAGLWVAVVADMGSSLLVTANAMRLIRPLRQDV